MKQKLLFLALMAISSQSLLSFGLYVGPGYGYYGPGYYPGYYGGPFDAVASIAGAAITADAIRSSNDSYSRKRDRDEDTNKSRRSELAGRIFDAEDELDSLERKKANSSDISEKREEIKELNRRLSALKNH